MALQFALLLTSAAVPPPLQQLGLWRGVPAVMFPPTQSPSMTPSSDKESDPDFIRMPYADDLVLLLSAETPSQTPTPVRRASPGGGLGSGSPSVEAQALPPAVVGEPAVRDPADLGSPSGGDEESRALNKRSSDASPVPHAKSPITSTRPRKLPATISNPPPQVRARTKYVARERSPDNPRAGLPPVADDDPPLNLLDCINILSKEPSKGYADIDLLDLVKMKGKESFPSDFEAILGSLGGGDEESRVSKKRLRNASTVFPAKSPITSTRPRKLPATISNPPPEVRARSVSPVRNHSQNKPSAAMPPVAGDDPPLNLLEGDRVFSTQF